MTTSRRPTTPIGILAIVPTDPITKARRQRAIEIRERLLKGDRIDDIINDESNAWNGDDDEVGTFDSANVGVGRPLANAARAPAKLGKKSPDPEAIVIPLDVVLRDPKTGAEEVVACSVPIPIKSAAKDPDGNRLILDLDLDPILAAINTTTGGSA